MLSEAIVERFGSDECEGIYGYMYGKPTKLISDKDGSYRTEPDKIIFIEKNPGLRISQDGILFIWGWPVPDANYYKFKDYGVTWAFTREELEEEAQEKHFLS